MVFIKESKVQKVIYSMRLNNIFRSIKDAEKNNKLAKLFIKMYNRLIGEGYKKLQKKTFTEPFPKSSQQPKR